MIGTQFMHNRLKLISTLQELLSLSKVTTEWIFLFRESMRETTQ
jgi:hypothetical protein